MSNQRGASMTPDGDVPLCTCKHQMLPHDFIPGVCTERRRNTGYVEAAIRGIIDHLAKQKDSLNG